MVGSVNNFLNPGDDVLVVNGGKFGERWTKICQAYGMKVEEIVVEWGHAVKPEQVEAALRRTRKIKAVFVQVTETSTGVNRREDLAGIVKRRMPSSWRTPSALSSPMTSRTDEWGIDVMIGGSQKGLMLPPGLAFVSVSDKAWKTAGYGKDAQVLLQLQERAGEPGQKPDELYLGRNAYHRPELLHHDAPGGRPPERFCPP